MKEMTDTDRITNRHKARLLQNLENAGCPKIFRDAVISEIDWLRSDLNETESIGDSNDGSETRFNR